MWVRKSQPLVPGRGVAPTAQPRGPGLCPAPPSYPHPPGDLSPDTRIARPTSCDLTSPPGAGGWIQGASRALPLQAPLASGALPGPPRPPALVSSFPISVGWMVDAESSSERTKDRHPSSKGSASRMGAGPEPPASGVVQAAASRWPSSLCAPRVPPQKS